LISYDHEIRHGELSLTLIDSIIHFVLLLYINLLLF